ncbi:hypothetical protein LTR84_009603 [Exophiala bonariae]|uniref:Uncharacterized protein n=1 Tax=Exophiala bonariae TaxID=1690606 RepID=A0AAV9NIW6_9EURO|nr:hypothetical protein LTR84_009603 [Exophiala bonariae]
MPRAFAHLARTSQSIQKSLVLDKDSLLLPGFGSGLCSWNTSHPPQDANLEPGIAEASPPNPHSTVHWLRLPLLSVELSENSGQISHRRTEFGEALQDLADQTIREAYIPVVQTGKPTRYLCFRNLQGHDYQRLEHKQKRTAVSLELPRTRKVELALKITESALLWRHYGFEADVCSCRLQLIMMTKNDPPRKQSCFGFEFATIPTMDHCVKVWHKELIRRGFHSIGVLLAELFSSENNASLKSLGEVSDDEISEGEEFNMLAKVAIDLGKVAWITQT